MGKDWGLRTFGKTQNWGGKTKHLKPSLNAHAIGGKLSSYLRDLSPPVHWISPIGVQAQYQYFRNYFPLSFSWGQHLSLNLTSSTVIKGYKTWSRRRYIICTLKESRSEVVQSCLTLCDHVDWCIAYQALYPWDFPSKSTGVVAISFSRGSSQPEIEPRSPTLHADTLPPEPPGNLRELQDLPSIYVSNPKEHESWWLWGY